MTGPKPLAEWLTEPLVPDSTELRGGIATPALPARTDFGRWADGTADDAQLTAAVDHGQQRQPDTHARVLKMQMRTGLPADIIERNLDQVEREAARADFNPRTFREQSPLVAAWFKNPDNVMVAHDDVANLSGLEWLLRAPVAAFREGTRQVELGQLRLLQMRGQATPEQIAKADQLSAQLTGGEFGADNFLSSSLISAARIAPTTLYPLLKGGRRGLAAATAAGGAAALAGQLGPQVAAPEELLTVPAAATGAGAIGMMSGSAEASYELEAGLAYDEYLKMKTADGQRAMSPESAAFAANLVGAVNASIEMLPTAILVRAFPGGRQLLGAGVRKTVRASLQRATVGEALKQFAINYGAVLGSEAITEMVQEGVTMAGGRLAAAIDGGTFQPMSGQDVVDRLVDTGVETAKGMLFLGLAGSGTTLFHDAMKARRASRQVQAIEALGESAKASKLRERMPEKYQEFVQTLREAGPVENVYIPVEQWETYFQGQGLDPAAVAAEVTGDVGQYFEAKDTGGDLVIPLDAYAARIAGTEHHAGLTDDIRMHQGDFTRREAKDWSKVAGDEYDRMVATMGEGDQPAASTDEGGIAPFVDQLTSQLEASGVESSIAQRQAELAGRIYTTMATRLGMTPEALAQRYQLSVGSPMAPVAPGFTAAAESDAVLETVLATSGQTAQEIPRLLRSDLPKNLAKATTEDLLRYLDHLDAMIAQDSHTLAGQAPDGRPSRERRQAIKMANMQLGQNQPLLANIEEQLQARGIDPEAHRDARLERASLQSEAGVAVSGKAFAGAPGVRASPMVPGVPFAPDATLAQGPIATDTPAFRAWFGDSKVVDAQGKPLVVFHGTQAPAEFDTFDAARIRNFSQGGFWFTSDLNYASGFVPTSRVMSVFLSIQNPATWEQYDAAAKEGDGTTASIQEILTRQGYDGVAFGTAGSPTWIAFTPTQIKSATGNRGTFSPTDPNILMQSAFHGSPHRFDKFTLDHIGSGEGAQAYGWGLYFAESRGVAEFYRKQLTQQVPSQRVTVDGASLDDAIKSAGLSGLTRAKVASALDATLDVDKAIENLNYQEQQSKSITDAGRAMFASARTFVESLRGKVLERSDRPTGQLYKVELTPTDDEYLLWDKPLSEQSEKVNGAIRQMLKDQRYLRPNDNGPRQLTAAWKAWINEHGGVSEGDRGHTFYSGLETLLGSARAASLALNAAGIRGIKYLDGGSRRSGEGNYNYVIFDEAAVQIAETFYQSQVTGGDARGFIQFGPDRRQFRVSLLEGADPSTFLHELGHFYLEVLQDAAGMESADPSVADDLATIRSWLQAEDGAPLTREQHEQWARGFEAYLFEGRAPSVDLIGTFARFKAWTMALYRQISSLNVTLTDDVRRTMDRMIASEEEIQRTRQIEGLQAMFPDAEAAGATSAEFGAYQRAQTRAEESGGQALLQMLLAEDRRATREWWRAERERVRADVAAEVQADPAWQALHYLQRGALLSGDPLPGAPVKLSRQILLDRYGEEGLAELAGLRPYVYAKDGGVDPDIVAPLFGYGSGDAMLQEMLAKQGQRMDTVIEGLTDARMRERHPGLVDDSALLGRAAMDAAHNDEQANVLLTELRFLGRQAGQAGRVDLDAVKALVTQMIGQKRTRDISPFQYQLAEAKAAKRAAEAVGAKDFGKAQMEKRKQLLNHLLYRAALDARTATEKAATYLARFATPDVRAMLGKAGDQYLAQMDALLTRFDFGRKTLKAIDRASSLADWIREQEAAGLQVEISDRLRNEAFQTHWKNLSFDDLMGLRDAAKNIEHLARFKNRLLTARAEIDFQEAATAIVDGILVHHTPEPTPPDFAKTWRDRLKTGVAKFDAAHVRPEFLFRWLDGETPNGPVWSALFKPMADAQAAEAVELRALAATLQGIFGRYTSRERAQWAVRRINVPAVRASFTKSTIMAVALNWGNEGNQQALMEGYGWSENQVMAILSHLDAKDLETVQMLWDAVDRYWPQIAALQKEMTGLEPERVTRVPSTINGVAMKGGYYPLKYDSQTSFLAFQRDERQNVKDLYGSNWTRPATKKGHTIERVGSAGQAVKLDLSVLTEHLNNVVHDLTHRRAIIDVDRLLQHPRVREAIEGTAGRELYRVLRPWLQQIANDRREPAGALERILGHARVGGTVVNMGLKVTTALSQVMGIAQTAAVLGPKYTARGMAAFLGTPDQMRAAMEFATSRSEELRSRREGFDREIRDIFKSLEMDGRVSQVQQAFFYLTGMMDMAIAVPTWLGAYQQGMEELFDGNEQQAIDHADTVLRTSQGTGAAKDLAAIQRGSEYHRIFTMFYSYFSVLYNLMRKEMLQQRAAGVSNLPRFAASMTMLWFMPAILGELLVGRGPDDDEEWPEWVATKLAQYPFQAIIGVRDLMNGVLGDYGYEASPVFDAGEALVKLGKSVGSVATGEDVTRQDVRAALDAAGYWGHLPTKQMWITGSFMYDWMTGADRPASPVEASRNLLFARPAR